MDKSTKLLAWGVGVMFIVCGFVFLLGEIEEQQRAERIRLQIQEEGESLRSKGYTWGSGIAIESE